MPYVIRTHVEYVDLDTDQMFLDWGLVGRWTGLITREVRDAVKVHTPIDKRQNKSRRNEKWPVGSLKKSIRGYTTLTAPKRRNMVIYSDVPYARYVNDGTGPIVGKPEMYLPYNRGFTNWDRANDPNARLIDRFTKGDGDWHRIVSGQDGQHFFTRGYRDVRLRHSSLPNMTPASSGTARKYL